MQMSDREVLEALQAQEDASEQMPQINSYYQDIEEILAHDALTMPQKLEKIDEINKKIGEITRQWV